MDTNEIEQTLQTIAEALEREAPLTVAEIVQLQRAHSAVLGAIDSRYRAIMPGGRERERVLATGTVDEGQALEREFERAKVLLAKHRAQSQALMQRRAAATASEASANLPALQQKLVHALDAAEAARDALRTAFNNLDAAHNDIQAARAAASRAFLPVTGADPAVIGRLVALRKWNGGGHVCLVRSIHDLCESLGVDERGKQQAQAAWAA